MYEYILRDFDFRNTGRGARNHIVNLQCSEGSGNELATGTKYTGKLEFPLHMLVHIENYMGKSPIVKKNCVNNYLI